MESKKFIETFDLRCCSLKRCVACDLSFKSRTHIFRQVRQILALQIIADRSARAAAVHVWRTKIGRKFVEMNGAKVDTEPSRA